MTAPERVGEALSGRWQVAPRAGGGGAGDAAGVEMALGLGFVWCRFSVFMPPALTAEPNIPPDIHPGTQVQGLYTRTELSETMLVMNLLKNSMQKQRQEDQVTTLGNCRSGCVWGVVIGVGQTGSWITRCLKAPKDRVGQLCVR